MKHVNLSLSLTFAALIALAGCSSPPQTKTSVGPGALTLLYQQGREGQIEPCGCHSHPYGGIDREWNALHTLRIENPKTLFVDAGDLFGPEKRTAPIAFYRDRGEALVKMVNELGLDIYAPGPLDYALGLEFLKKAESKATFKFVSTNVVDASGKTPFSPYQLKEVGGVTVAVVSVMGSGAKLGDGLKVVDGKAAIDKALAEIGTRAQLVIALSATGSHVEDRNLAHSIPGVHIWIGNDGKIAMDEAEVRNKALLIDGHRYGYFLGKVDLDLALPIKGFYSETVIATNKQMLSGYEKGLAALTDPKRKAAVQKKIADFKATEQFEVPSGASRFEHRFVALDEKTYGAPNDLTTAVSQEKERVRKSAVNSPTKPIKK